MREVLSKDQYINEAVEIFKGYNLDMGGGPPFHHMIADATGQSILIEYFGGEMVVITSERVCQGLIAFYKLL